MENRTSAAKAPNRRIMSIAMFLFAAYNLFIGVVGLLFVQHTRFLEIWAQILFTLLGVMMIVCGVKGLKNDPGKHLSKIAFFTFLVSLAAFIVYFLMYGASWGAMLSCVMLIAYMNVMNVKVYTPAQALPKKESTADIVAQMEDDND